MLSFAHASAGAIQVAADRLLNRITQSRQKGDTRLANRSNVRVGVGTRLWAFKQDMPQVADNGHATGRQWLI
jgi:hypothetical protein